MDYFWIIPVAFVVVFALWAFFVYIRRTAGERKDGEVLTDKPRRERRI
jgi:hypothetical protein